MDELRRYLLDSVSRSSGHFASGLGTVRTDRGAGLCLQHPV
ncbi:1-deoxy-D-xylulose-5-phosphate synthase N-terminal domain-containing protein [Escherichia coli]